MNAVESLLADLCGSDQVDRVPEEIYDYVCAHRKDNLNPDGSPGDPRKIGCPFSELYDEPKNFYRNLAVWHLTREE
jgi:hypothetical protein